MEDDNLRLESFVVYICIRMPFLNLKVESLEYGLHLVKLNVMMRLDYAPRFGRIRVVEQILIWSQLFEFILSAHKFPEVVGQMHCSSIHLN